MRASKALKIILIRWGITRYRISLKSGLDRGTIGKLISGEREAITWDTTEKIANGLAAIDPVAKGAFMYALGLAEDSVPDPNPDDIAICTLQDVHDTLKAIHEGIKSGSVTAEDVSGDLKRLNSQLESLSRPLDLSQLG